MVCSLLTDADGDPIPPASRLDGAGNPTGQDGHVGRDVTHNDDSDGHAGFSFTKIGTDGKALAIQNQTWIDTGSEVEGTQWSCVKDNVTGLIWEIKQGAGNAIYGDNGLHDPDDRYTWYNTNPATNGGEEGVSDIDRIVCFGYLKGDSSTWCNTEAYVKRVNTSGWCGVHDWRMPSRQELRSIVDEGHFRPTMDTAYFPDAGSDAYWTGIPDFESRAQTIFFYNGGDFWGDRSYPHFVRLVRSGQ
ncbi:MAG: DUF1566 domain-containing protein [Candidatus Thiothrix putei]|uniref:DUF1566 domain-containing protein n=1 Tax=Candidatus Thiothrix putei TaxID=3080811 RepID=A0AA95HG59_9GAMM|nr:MAG: DUF1566 domain-containing protein [Candidatus Thiothrix putei]